MSDTSEDSQEREMSDTSEDSQERETKNFNGILLSEDEFIIKINDFLEKRSILLQNCKNMKLYKKFKNLNNEYINYIENPLLYIMRLFPEYINNEYEWQLFICSRYQSKDFRFLDNWNNGEGCNNTVKTFVINIIMNQQNFECCLMDMSCVETAVNDILFVDNFDDILTISEIFIKTDFLHPKDSKDFSYLELNQIMLDESIKDSQLKNNNKMDKLFKFFLEEENIIKDCKIEINITFGESIDEKLNLKITKFVHDFIFSDDYFISALESFNTRIFNFNFPCLNISEVIESENFITELFRYFYTGNIILSNLTLLEIESLWSFSDEKCLVLKDICYRYLTLNDSLFTSTQSKFLEMIAIDHPTIPYPCFLFKLSYDNSLAVVSIDGKLYYLDKLSKSYNDYRDDEPERFCPENILKLGVYNDLKYVHFKYFKDNNILYDLNIRTMIYNNFIKRKN